MKFTNPLPQFKKCIILFLLSISCSTLSYLIYLVDPVKLVLDYKLQMAPDSMLFKLWKKPPIDVYIKVYIFNITNAEEFLKGGVKLKVQEIGPYVYQEFVENENVTWHENGTISFIPMRKIVYVPKMSVGNPEEDWVQVPNIPMLGFFSTMHNAGFFMNYPLTSLTNVLQSKSILHLTVQEYLWGYEDPLIRLASGILPNYIDFGKFGLLDREKIKNINGLEEKRKKEKKKKRFSSDWHSRLVKHSYTICIFYFITSVNGIITLAYDCYAKAKLIQHDLSLIFAFHYAVYTTARNGKEQFH